MKRVELGTEEEQFVAMLRALGNPARYYIFREVLRRGTYPGSSLLAELPLAQSTISEHLRRLREVGILEGEVTGSTVTYSVSDSALSWFREQVGGLETALPGPEA